MNEQKDEGNGAMKEGRTNGRHRQFFKRLLNVILMRNIPLHVSVLQ